MRHLLLSALIGFAGIVSAFAALPPLERVPPEQLPQIGAEGDLEGLKLALRRQLAHCEKADPRQSFSIGDRAVTLQKWCLDTNRAFLKLAEQAPNFAALMREARTRFEWYRTRGRNGAGEVLFTGYHAPVLEASLTPTAEFSIPLYRKPSDLVQVREDGKLVWRQRHADGKLTPYPDKATLERTGHLRGKGLELAYIRDRFDAAILRMEGAGALLIRQSDGSHRRQFINYAAANGHPWTSTTQYLREAGLPDERLSIPEQRKYFAAHPEALGPALARDQSYVFYKFDAEGPYGVGKMILTPRHSLAADLGVFPVGAVTWFQTQRPIIANDELAGWHDFSTLAVVQDTGSAIRGPGRIDIFWGEDSYAEQASGRMRQLGTLYVAILP